MGISRQGSFDEKIDALLFEASRGDCVGVGVVFKGLFLCGRECKRIGKQVEQRKAFDGSFLGREVVVPSGGRTTR